MKKTSDDVANEVIMTRKACQSLVLLVEGSSDVKVFRKFLASADSEVISSWGKNNLLGAIEILESEKIQKGVLGIIDADFCHLDSQIPDNKNVIMTDAHDIEMMIIGSKSFSNFIFEIASIDKLNKFLSNSGLTDIREILLSHAAYVGYLRRYSIIKNLNLCFEKLDFEKFVKKDTFDIDVVKLIESVLSLTKNPDLKSQEISSQLASLMSESSDDLYQICCGHDVISILGIGLRKCIASKSLKESDIRTLESQLRMSYDSSCFCRSLLYEAARAWSHKNPGYQVFS
jgi:hypothetical protein